VTQRSRGRRAAARRLEALVLFMAAWLGLECGAGVFR
jgi:hypothetical protein